ncbi:MAG: zinc ribbon domain-containing protein [Cyanobacteria bacterium]|nr:zinc ribbon domain-containing protein [Cyanobacteriota bacterium]
MQRVCPNCQADNPASNRFCFGCGKNLLTYACVYCHQELLPDAKYCGGCGSPVTLQCGVCGFKNLPEQTFCGSCASPLKPDNTVPDQSPSPPQSRPPISPSGMPVPQAVPQDTDTQKQTPTVPTEKTADKIANTHKTLPFERLSHYGLISLECQVPKEWSQSASPEERQALLKPIQHFLLRHGATIESSQGYIVFASFQHEVDTIQSLHKAVHTALKMLEANFAPEDPSKIWGLPLRIGLDLVNKDDTQTVASVTERSVAPWQGLVVSGKVYDMVSADYLAQTIGPLKMGSRMMTFFRLLKPKQYSRSSEPITERLTESNYPGVEPSKKANPAKQTVTPVDYAEPQHSESQETGYIETPSGEPHSLEPSSPGNPESNAETASLEEVDPFLPPEEPLTLMLPHIASFDKVLPNNTAFGDANRILCEELTPRLSLDPELKGKIYHISAPDGLGKSHLLHSLRAQIDTDQANPKATWIGGNNYRCYYDIGIPLLYWQELIQNFFALSQDGHPKEDVKHRIEQVLTHIYQGTPAENTTDFFETLLNVSDLSPLNTDSVECVGLIRQHLLDLAQQLCNIRPLILIFEDIDQADIASVQLLLDLCQNGLMDLPVTILLSSRPDFTPHPQSSKIWQLLPVKSYVIAPMTDDEVVQLLESGPMSGQMKTIPMPVLQQLIQTSGGLPLTLFENIRVMHLEGILQPHPKTGKLMYNKKHQSSWQGNTDLSRDLSRLFQRRLEVISADALYVLQVASIFGEKFTVALVGQLTQLENEPYNAALKELFDHGFIIPDAVNSGRFINGVVWEFVYESVSSNLKLQLHQLISEYLEQAIQQGQTVNPCWVAYHAYRCGHAQRAFIHWYNMALYNAQLGDLLACNIALFRAKDCLDYIEQSGALTSTEQISAHQGWMTQLMESIGLINSKQQAALAIHALQLAIQRRLVEDNRALLVENYGTIATAFETLGRFHHAVIAIDKALDCIDPETYPVEYASLSTSKMEYWVTMGQFQKARQLFEQTIQPLFESQRPERDSLFYTVYLNAYFLLGTILVEQLETDAMHTLEVCHEEARHETLFELEIAIQLTQARAYLYWGDMQRCRAMMEPLLESIEALDNPTRFLAQWGYLAMMYHTQLSDWENASLLVPNNMYQAEQAGDYATWTLVNAYAGWLTQKKGKLQEARNILENQIEASAEHRLASSALIGWRFLSETELKIGSDAVASEIAERAFTIASKPDIGNRREHLLLGLSVARCQIKIGQLKTAGQLLEQLWPHVTQTQAKPLMAETAGLIGELYLQIAEQASPAHQAKHQKRAKTFLNRSMSLWSEIGNHDLSNQVGQLLTHSRLAS